MKAQATDGVRRLAARAADESPRTPRGPLPAVRPSKGAGLDRPPAGHRRRCPARSPAPLPQPAPPKDPPRVPARRPLAVALAAALAAPLLPALTSPAAGAAPAAAAPVQAAATTAAGLGHDRLGVRRGDTWHLSSSLDGAHGRSA